MIEHEAVQRCFYPYFRVSSILVDCPRVIDTPNSVSEATPMFVCYIIVVSLICIFVTIFAINLAATVCFSDAGPSFVCLIPT